MSTLTKPRTMVDCRSQWGLTLVELMVALAISLTLVVAASMMFLNTRFTQIGGDERAQLRETGQQALEMIGRQVANAGFYPMISEEEGSAQGQKLNTVLITYKTAIELVDGATPHVGLTNGLFGCKEGVVAADLSGCSSNTTTVGATKSDSLTVAYFTTDAMSADVGWRADCTRADIANDDVFNGSDRIGTYTKSKTTNGQTTEQEISRGAEAEGLPPASPLLGINQFFLRPLKNYLNDAGTSVDTFALACRGNGNKTGGTMEAVDLLPGVEQLTLRYGVAGDSTGAATQFLDASEVSALTDPVVVGTMELSGWGRVVSVQVCVLVRSLSPGAAKVSGGTTQDCLGANVSAPGVLYQTFTQTFGVKNRLQQSVGL